MNKQTAVSAQIINNMKGGITSAEQFLTDLKNTVGSTEQTNEAYLAMQANVIADVTEIISFLEWVKPV